MPTPTYRPIATFTATGGESSVTFSSIPSSFRDITLAIDADPSAGDSSINMSFNSDTATANYPSVYFYGDGSGTGGGSLVSTGVQIGYLPNGGRSIIVSEILDYSVTDKFTTVLSRQSDYNGWQTLWQGTWRNTNAVTQINISFAQARTWSAGTTITLFGIES